MKPEITDWFDKYLQGQLNEEEIRAFQEALNKDAHLKKSFEDYQLLIQSFQDYHQKDILEKKFNEWYYEESAGVFKNKKIWWNVSYIAASVALLVTLTGIWIYENLVKETKKQGNEITYLKKELKHIQTQQNTLVRSIKKIQEKNYAPANSQSTGFLFAPKYILTTYHSIQNADSVFVENEFFPRTEASVIYVNKGLDVALLYVKNLNTIPFFQIYKNVYDLGQKVYTLGYPTNQPVYNEGYISAVNGYDNDTAFYQITMSLNPGNSGGPLFSNDGKLIGMIVSKNISMEGVAFALKSNMLYTLKDSIPADSIKAIWLKTYKANKYGIQNNNQVSKAKSVIFKISVYQKTNL